MILFVRHAQSWSNAGHKHIFDSPLTNLGRTQAQNLKFDTNYIICSPMRRTKETLQHSNITINGENIFTNLDHIEINEYCREKKCGKSSWLLLEKPTNSPDRESDSDFLQRIRHFGQHLLDCLQFYNTITIITHGCVITSLTGIIPNNAEIIVCDIEIIKKVVNGDIVFEHNCCHV